MNFPLSSPPTSSPGVKASEDPGEDDHQGTGHQSDPSEIPAEGTERVIDGRRRGYFGGYWIKVYPVPEDNLVEKRRLIAALTRRLFNHVEHGLYVPGERLEEARQAYESEMDAEKKRIKGGMLAGALFNRAADILTKLVELQAMGIDIGSSDPLMRRCGQHLQEALSLGRSVLHRSGEEGIDELWGEPFKAFAYPIREFYHSRYIKLSMTMRCIDDIAIGASEALEECPGMSGVGTAIYALAEAGKDYAQSLRSDPGVFDCWSSLAVAREHLKNFHAKPPKKSLAVERDLALEGERLAREVCKLLFHIARARVPMPKSAAALCLRCRALSERAKSVPSDDDAPRGPSKAPPQSHLEHNPDPARAE
jgi:hypothetical protein